MLGLKLNHVSEMGPWTYIQCVVSRLSLRSCQVSRPRYVELDLYDLSEIRKAPQQHINPQSS